MPVPLILAALGLVAGSYGVKKGLDAKKDMDQAEWLNDSAEFLAEGANDLLKCNQEITRDAIEKLGEEKISILSTSIKDFVDSFQQIKHVNLKETKGIDELKNLKLTEVEFAQMRDASYQVSDVAVGGLSSVASGVAIAYGSYGVVGLLGAASTGTAISGLSGVAATNATLAWLGGGSLAVGGFGVAGGMAVLGGLVAGPALALGGSMMASKARKAVNDAKSNIDKAKLYQKQVETICEALEGIFSRTCDMNMVLIRLDGLFIEYVTKMQGIISQSGNDWKAYTQDERENIGKCTMLALAIKKILDTRLLTDDGELYTGSLSVVKESEAILDKLA